MEHDGFSIKEIAAAIEAYAVSLHKEETRTGLFDDPPSGSGNGLFSGGGGGLFSSNSDAPHDHGRTLSTVAAGKAGVADALLNRANALREKQPGVADKIWELLATWPDPTIDHSLLKRLREEPVNLPLANVAVKRAKRLRKNELAALRPLLKTGGMRAGLVAALLGDPPTTLSILKGDDVEAIRMLLASARLMRTPLPIPVVQQLFARNNPKIADAAEQYLYVEDSPEARRIILGDIPARQ